jgi:uroporphyrinogen III methyltransferase/synthase
VLLGDAAHGHGLAKALFRKGMRGKRVLAPAARIGRVELVDKLRAAGAVVDVVPVYDTRAPRDPDPLLLDALRTGTVDVVALASPSAAGNLWNALGGPPHDRVHIACIGPTTAAAASELGFRVDLVAATPSLEGLVEALLQATRLVQPGG